MARSAAANLLVIAALLAGAASAYSADAGLYLYQIPSTRTDLDSRTPGAATLADLFIGDPTGLVKQLSETSNLSVISTTGESVRVSIAERSTLTHVPAESHLAASFVIDHRETTILELVDTLKAQHGPEPSIDSLTDFVHNTITVKSYRRSFDLASQVAINREGDCTEHAVLLVALARAIGKPARVVLGVLLADTRDGVGSFGHAWAEIHDGDGWQIADATRPDLQLPDAWIRHLPLLELSDEGPGYSMQLLNLTIFRPVRIELISG